MFKRPSLPSKNSFGCPCKLLLDLFAYQQKNDQTLKSIWSLCNVFNESLLTSLKQRESDEKD
jgi:hypothetical protein